MCDPFIGGIIAGVGSIASGIINYSSQMDAMNKQNEANAQWVSYQRQQSQEAWAKDVANREKASAAQQDTLNKVSAPSQVQQQQTEQGRLTQAITPQDLQQGNQDKIVGDALLSGQQNANPEVKKAMADQITNAAQLARQRIANLATIQSYGGSQFGLQNTVNQAFQTGNQQIDLTGNYRRGDLAAYNVAKNVEPERFQMTPSPWGGIASGLASIAGKGLSTPGFGFNVNPAGTGQS